MSAAGHAAGEAERELLPTATGARTRAVLRELLRPHRLLAAGALAVLAAATGVGLLTAPLLGHIVDLVAGRQPASALTLPVVGLLLVAPHHRARRRTSRRNRHAPGASLPRRDLRHTVESLG